jgi:2-octaprenyl-6-methoxyphenol hydroxylase
VNTHDDPVRALNDTQRIAVLNSIFPALAGRVEQLEKPLKAFPLGLNAERTLVDKRAPIVRIGNAAQTLHPVAGQGLNLGFRDAHALCDALTASTTVEAALKRVEWQRAPDRWALIASTDFLARSFTWALPGADLARGAAMALLDRATPLKRLLAKQMMFGSR